MLLETLIWLLDNLRNIDGNVTDCKTLRSKYRPLLDSTNTKKINKINEELSQTLTSLYTTHRDDIVEKDFSWMETGMFIFSTVDISAMYRRLCEADADDKLSKVNNDLLLLFHEIAPDEDKKLIEEKHKKKEVVPTATPALTPKTGKPKKNMAMSLERIMEQNADIFKEAEKDPSKMGEAFRTLISRNGPEFGDLLSDTLSNMGIDFSSLPGAK